MTAEILSIGDELLIGQVINTNQAYIAERLNSVGIEVRRMTTVGDNEEEILHAFKLSLDESDVVAVTGGLGPTHDDLTREAVCKFFSTDLVVDQEALENVKRIFTRRNLPLLKINEDQARVPRGCIVMQNAHGTAPGYFFERQGKFMFVMPGVTFEMKAMMENFVLPYFTKKGTGRVIRHRTLKTTGIPESYLAEQIGSTDQYFSSHSGITLAYLPSPTGVRLRISVQAAAADGAERKIEDVVSKLRQKIGKYVYSYDDEELEYVVGKILADHHLTMAVAESCTGGLIADRITNVPGSSRYFERGIIAYSNESKIDEIGVPAKLISEFGAVSKQVAEAMAEGVRISAGTDIGLSTTGVAGPTGGTEEKPVGLVWIGYSDADQTLALRFNFGDDRRRVKERAMQAALELLRRKLLKMSEA